MNLFPKFRFIVIIAISTTMTACADYLSDNNTKTSSARIGLPSEVNVLNTDITNALSRTTGDNKIPNIHTSAIMGAENPLFCRYTTTPGIISRKNSNKTNTIANTRGVAITTNSFYDSYSLYSYVYPSFRTWAATTQIVGKRFDETCFDEEVKLSKSWITNEFWPSAQERCAFFAYAPYHAKGLSKFTTGGWPTFHYSVPTNVTEQSDLLVTKNEIPANASAYGNIDISGGFNKPDSITFDHACTAIRFAIGDQMAPGVIKKITINNVYSTGDYNYETESWSNVDSLKTFTLTQNFEIKPGEHNKILNNDDNIFMMIPQKLPTDATMEITVDDGTERTIKAYIRNDEWKKGYTVTYYLSTAKIESSYVLSIAPASGNIACAGGTKAITINSYKQTYYGTQIAVPWTASYTYDDADQVGTTIYNTSTDVVPGFVTSGNGSATGESVNFQTASQVARSKSWRSAHTQTLRNATDASGNLAANKRTANCYVVQAPGTYTFPLVYGNALNADGSSNNDSYKTATFVDHNGIQIDNPYIYATNGGANVPHDACIVWQDAPHLVTPSSVQLTSDKQNIQFTIERKNICAGNCVIAVRDKDQNIMWSWHIWVTDHNMANTTAVKNQDGITNNFMEVPLGWCDSEVRIYDPRTFHITVSQTETGGKTATASVLQLNADSTYTYGPNAPYYQWGRKDPMLPSNGLGNINKPYYDNQYTPLITINSTDIKDLILNPNKHCVNYTSTYLELWNKGNTITTINNNPVHKTIYDPNPYLYKMPTPGAISGFTSSNITGTYNMGWNFYCNYNATGPTIFLSALGVRDTGSANIFSYNYGVYHTSTPSSATTCFDLNFGYNYVYTNSSPDSRIYGFTVRPTSE